jgi:high affinity choline transporter 7
MVNVLGVISIVVFYLLILCIGLWAGRKRKNRGKDCSKEDEIILAGRNLGTIVGIFTMTATWVAGGYINGTAEIIYTDGLLWCQAPFGNAISLLIGAYG